MIKVTVCKDCRDRQVGCHGSCERYITEKKQKVDEHIAMRKAYYGLRTTITMEADRSRKAREKWAKSRP